MTLRENFIVNTEQFSQGTRQPIGKISFKILTIYLQIAMETKQKKEELQKTLGT